MRRTLRSLALFFILALAGLYHLPPRIIHAQAPEADAALIGHVIDTQNQPISQAEVRLQTDGGEVTLAEAVTQPDGSFVLSPEQTVPDNASLRVERPHFKVLRLDLSEPQIQRLQAGESLTLESVTLTRKISPAFWIATIVFIVSLALIAVGKLHNTLSALLGAALVLGVSYLGPPLNPDLFVFDFHRALEFVDWNVIFLIMGMMIVIAVVERTGIFQWLAFAAYNLSGGRVGVLMAILMVFTGVASALLDNVTTMLLMTPITVRIALALGINPLSLLMPEVMASNVVGISTLIGTPTNILIGSFASISFNDFLVNQTPGVVLALIGLILYSEWVYRKEVREAGEMSPMLLERLEEGAKIAQPDHLKKAGWIGAGMLVLFVMGERIHLLPAVTAILGATALLVWIRPDIEEMIEAVDWTTLVFFIALFIVVGSIQEVGLISMIADLVGQAVGASLVLAIFAITILSALLSGIVANIPFTAAMLPVIAFLSTTVPGAENKVLFYCLSVGAAMGGNGSLIGASANMVTAGIAERAGYPITYMYFLRKGFPAMLITVGLALIWLLIRFL